MPVFVNSYVALCLRYAFMCVCVCSCFGAFVRNSAWSTTCTFAGRWVTVSSALVDRVSMHSLGNADEPHNDEQRHHNDEQRETSYTVALHKRVLLLVGIVYIELNCNINNI